MALHEWGLTPDYINTRWTEELLATMFISRARRFQRMAKAMNDPEGNQPELPLRFVSEEELFKTAGYEPEEVVVKCPSASVMPS